MFNFFCKAPEVPQWQYRTWGRKQRVLEFFQERQWQRVPLPFILQTFRDIADPTRTIRYLSADGYDITNEVEHTKHGHSVHSYYTYNGISAHFDEPKEKYSKKEQKAYDSGYAAAQAQYTN